MEDGGWKMERALSSSLQTLRAPKEFFVENGKNPSSVF
jgi:hypothetical protein